MNRILAAAFAFAGVCAALCPSAHAAAYAVGQRLECDGTGLHKYYKPGVVIPAHPGETFNGYAAGSGYFYRIRVDGGDPEGTLCKAEDSRPPQGAAQQASSPSVPASSHSASAAAGKQLFAALRAGKGAPSAPAAPPAGGNRFGTRDPRKCAPVKTQPNVEQIKAILQCYDEGKSTRDLLYLDENISIQAGATRRFIEFSDNGSFGIDTTAPVIPIRGSVDAYQCAPLSKYTNTGTVYDTDNTGKSCAIAPVRNSTGTCYRTTFGEWECRLYEAMSSTQTRLNQPPPRR